MCKRVPVWLLAIVLAGTAHAAVRIALVGSGPEKDTANLLALAEARLPEDNRIELLERTAIHKVLDEQKLSLAGLVDEDKAVAAGKLLRVEVLAVVQRLGPDAPPVLTVFDAFNGARLVDVDLPKDNVDEQVGAIVLGIDRSRQKLVAPLHAKTMCLLAVRNADLPRAMDPMCNALGSLLERQLLTSDDVRLLERKRLEGINKERQLGTLDPKHDILASLVTIELEFSRGKEDKEPTVTALLSDGAGKSIAKPSVTVDLKNLAEAVNQLASKIAEALQVVPGQAGLEPAKEGRRFLAEAEFLLAHGETEAGLQAAESAYALGPQSPIAARELAFALLRRAIEIQHHDKEQLPAALDMAARAMDIRDAELMNLKQTNPHHHDLKVFPDNLTGEWVMMLLQNALSAEDANVADAARRLGDSYVHFAHEWVVSSESLSAGNEADLAHHMEFIRLNRVVPALALACASKSDYVTEVTGMYERYFSLLAHVPAIKSIPLYLLAARDLGDPVYWTLPERKWWPADFAKDELPRIDHLYQMLIDHPSSAVRFYGLRDRLQFLRFANRMSDEEFAAAYAEARDAARAGLDDEVLVKSDRGGLLRNAMIGNAMTIVGQGKNPERWLDDRIGWYDFFVARGELPQLSLVALFQFVKLHASGEDVVKVLRAVEKLVDDPQTQIIGCSRVEARTQFAENVRVLSSEYPEVRKAFAGAAGGVKVLLKTGEEIASIDDLMTDETGGAFAIVSANEGGERSLRAISLGLDGATRTIGSIASDAKVSDACVTKDRIVVATDQGIVLFARTGGSTAKITIDDGLPTNDVQSVAMLGDVIYAGLRDNGYLVSYDMASRACKVLASSRRKEKASPFDDAGEFAIVRIVADEAKQRVLLVHCHAGRFHGNGLWQFDPATSAFTQLLHVYFDYGDRNVGASRLLPDGRMVISSYNWAAAFDTKTDSVTLLFADSIGAGPDLRSKTRPFEFNHQIAWPYTLVGDELWCGAPLSRIEPNTNHIRQIDLPHDADPTTDPTTRPTTRRRLTARPARPSDHMGPNDCLWIEPMRDEEHVIAGNAHAVWLVSIKESPSTSQPSSRPTHE